MRLSLSKYASRWACGMGQAGRAEAEKGASVTTLLANARRAADDREGELRKAMRDGEAKLQTRNSQLEADIAGLRKYSILTPRPDRFLPHKTNGSTNRCMCIKSDWKLSQ